MPQFSMPTHALVLRNVTNECPHLSRLSPARPRLFSDLNERQFYGPGPEPLNDRNEGALQTRSFPTVCLLTLTVAFSMAGWKRKRLILGASYGPEQTGPKTEWLVSEAMCRETVLLAHQKIDLHWLVDVMHGLDGYFSGHDRYLDDLQRASSRQERD